MQLSMLLMADYATADASGKLNILGAFNSLNSPQFPVKHPLMHLVMKFLPALGEYGDVRTLRVILVDPNGKELLQISGDMQIPVGAAGQIPEVNAIIGLRDVEFTLPGPFEFRVFVDKEQKGDITLQVNHVAQPER